MGQEVVYCSVCGDRLTGLDFEKGRAVTVLKRHFCRACSRDAVKQASEGPGHDPTVTPTKIKVRTTRMPLAEPVAHPSPRLPLIIAAAVILVALALATYVFLGKQG